MGFAILSTAEGLACRVEVRFILTGGTGAWLENSVTNRPSPIRHQNEWGWVGVGTVQVFCTEQELVNYYTPGRLGAEAQWVISAGEISQRMT